MRTQLLLGLAVSILAVWVRVDALRHPLPPVRPGTENERVAASLAAGRGWSDAFDHGTGPTAHTAPVYPLVLAGIYRLFGDYETETGRGVQRGLSIALTVVSLLLLPVLARKLGLSVTAGWLAAFVGAWKPINLRVELSGGHENVLAVLALLGLIWCLVDLRQQGWSGRAAQLRTGGLLGLTALLAPNFLLIPVLFFSIELVCRREERVSIVRCGFLLATISFLMATPWMIRNYRVLGGFVPLRSNFGLELAVGNRPGADGNTYTNGMWAMHPYRSAAERARLIAQGELAYMRDKKRQALNWIRENPRQFVWLMGRRARLFWVTIEETWQKIDIAYLQLYLPKFTILTVAAFLEVLRLLRKNPPIGRLMACVLIGAGLPYLVTHVELRYRLSITGLYLLLFFNLGMALLSGSRRKLVDLVAALRPQPQKVEGC